MSTESEPRTVIFFGINDSVPNIFSSVSSFLNANSTAIALLGSPGSGLDSVANELRKISSTAGISSKIYTQEVDLKSPESIGIASHNIRAELGAWDVFLNCTALATTDVHTTTIRGADEDEWWDPFERNVKTMHSIARHFLSKMKANAVFVNLSTVSTNAESGAAVNNDKKSADTSSQLAAARVALYLAVENAASGLRVLNVLFEPEQSLSYETFLSWTKRST